MGKKLPPDGYRLLDVGEIILPGDIYFDLIKWKLREKDCFNLKMQINWLPTARFIEKSQKEMEKEKINYSFFVPRINKSWGDSLGGMSFCASHNKGAHYFLLDERHTFHDPNSSYKALKNLENLGQDYKEVSLQDIKKKFSLSQFKLICKKLDITIEKLEITPEKKEKIIQFLKQSRAFNQDSAMIMSEDEDICWELSDENVIKREKNKFYVE